MRHKWSAAVLISAIAYASTGAKACTCRAADPGYRLPDAEIVFVAEVVNVDSSTIQQAFWLNGKPANTFAVQLRVVETLVGRAADGGFFEETPDAPCSANFKPGERRIVLLRKSSQRLLHLCDTISGDESYVSKYRQAVKARK